MERVSVIKGDPKSNILVVAPHGFDDTYTDVIAEKLQIYLNCHAVINRCFERADEVDSVNDKANCNSFKHVSDSVVEQEFLKPIKKSVETYYKNQGQVLNTWGHNAAQPFCIFWIHGMGKNHHAEFVLGYGLGKTNSLTMQEWRVKMFYDKLCNIGHVALGAPGGKYSARSKDNMTQYFCKHSTSWAFPSVEAVQIEITSTFRSSQNYAEAVAVSLATRIKAVADATAHTPNHPSYKQI